MALAVLSDSPELWQKAAQLYRNTSAEYFRWGRYEPWVQGRHLGECSETLRDIVHAQFGMGGLLQAAELAWQQVRLSVRVCVRPSACMLLHSRAFMRVHAPGTHGSVCRETRTCGTHSTVRACLLPSNRTHQTTGPGFVPRRRLCAGLSDGVHGASDQRLGRAQEREPAAPGVPLL